MKDSNRITCGKLTIASQSNSALVMFLHTIATGKYVQVIKCRLSLQLGMLARPCNLATGELVLWTVGGRGSLGEIDYVELASALRLASAWSHCGSTL